jgi:hypothetical protein
MTDIYELSSPIANSNSRVEFTNNESGHLFEFFIPSENQHLPPKKMKLMAQTSLTDEHIAKADFLDAIVSIPIFSDRLVKKLQDRLSGDLLFYPCTVNQSHIFHAGKILKSLKIIDYSNSKYMPLSDPNEPPILFEPKFISPQSDFFIARDINESTRYVVSDKFKNLMESEGFEINFKKANN